MDRRDDDVGKVVPEERISHRPGDMNAGGMHHRSSLRCEEAGTPLDEEHVAVSYTHLTLPTSDLV